MKYNPLKKRDFVPRKERCSHMATPGDRTHVAGFIRYHVCSLRRGHDGAHVCDGWECRPRHYNVFSTWDDHGGTIWVPTWLTPEWCMSTFFRVNPGANVPPLFHIPSLYLLDFARAVVRRTHFNKDE